ncbi:helix-turn-helix transcriptional regulator [Paenibacillus sp. 598K]|uniref:helix-turn-helix transcriptional regulator n=1 Tax=Paenibacillus sp. 598K TaxID=1117987 RepID=UPI000FFE50CD|nr:helix-turn-helix domain-containing protein [Paenibacillus sp. 598K]
MNAKLKAARRAKGLTQADMAAMLGYRSKSGYAMVENGKNTPPLDVALAIARIVGQDVETLFQRDKE